MIGIAFLAAGLFGLVVLALLWMARWTAGPMNDENAEAAERHCPICHAEPAHLCKRGEITLMQSVHRARTWGSQ